MAKVTIQNRQTVVLAECPHCERDDAYFDTHILEPEPYDEGLRRLTVVRCLYCGAEGPPERTKAEAAKGWNRREQYGETEVQYWQRMYLDLRKIMAEIYRILEPLGQAGPTVV